MRNRVIACAATGGIVLVAAGAAVASGNYQIAGSTLVKPAFNAWCVDIGGNFCTDSGGGSGAGVTAFVSNTVDWADSDAPLKASQVSALKSAQPGAGYRYFLTLIGGIAVPTHFSGEKKAIKLTGNVIADIFDGSVTKWDAKQISQLNPGVKFPNSTIVECVRGDSSGTSYNFTNYLARVSSAFNKSVGPASNTPNWKGTHTTFGTGGGLEASCVQSTSNAIGYVDYANTIGVDSYLSAIGHVYKHATYYTAPNTTTIAAAAAQAAKAKVSLTNPITIQDALLNTAAKSAYPISLTSFLLTYQNYTKVHAARESASAQWAATKKFLTYAISPTGQSKLHALDFAKLPAGWINLDKGLEKTVKP
jgi:phosphate transport system substrate-binding protein